MKTAFVFTGCGALGAYQAGAAFALTVGHGVVPDAVYGVSSGAVNAVAYNYLGAEGNVDFWKQIDQFSDAFELNLWNMIFRGGDGVFRHGKRMREWMRSSLEGKVAAMPGRIYVIKADTGELRPFNFIKGWSGGELPFDYGMASCAVPGMCQNWAGLVDAGTRVLAPLKDAVDDGADRIYLISGRPIGIDEPRKMFWPRAAAAGYYAVDSALTEILRRDIEVLKDKNLLARTMFNRYGADRKLMNKVPREIDLRVIAPTETIGGSTDFADSQTFLALGKQDALNYRV